MKTRPAVAPRLLGAALLALVCTVAAAGDGDPEEKATGPLEGGYEGQVYNGDGLDPVLTVFFRDGQGNWRGTYAVGEEAGFEAGALDDCAWEVEYLLRCQWSDKYGKGVARLLFSADYRSFRGFWGNAADETTLPWDGVRP